MLLDLIRFCRGYVTFEVRGRFPERFLNIAARNNLRLWRAERSSDCLTAAMYMRDYHRSRRLAASCGVRLHLIEKRGLPVVLRRIGGRIGVPVGAGAFAAAVFVMSLFVWSIDVTGLEHISESEMRSALAEHGLYVGAFKPAVDYGTVSRQVMLEDSRVGWMAINVSGSYASVEVKEEVPAPEIADVTVPCNVKASRDGVLLRIETGEGKCLLKEGSGVVQGQLVVSGVMEDALGGARLVHADARVLAQTRYEARFELPKERSLLRPTGETAERYALNLFGLRLPLTAAWVSTSRAVTDTTEASLTALDVRLPLGVFCERVTALDESMGEYDDNSAKELLQKQSQLYEAFTLSHCTVTDRACHMSYEDGAYTMTALYTCEEDIAYQEEIGIGDTAPSE